MNSSKNFQIDLRQMILAIETTVDLVGMNDTNHAKRVGFIASQIGHNLGLSDEDIQYVFELGLLHDCGVSTHEMHANLVNYFDWEESKIHCEIGYKLLSKFEPLSKFAIPILYHHTHYEKLKNIDISQRDAFMANLIFLSDRVDVLSAAHYGKDIHFLREEIVNSIKKYSGTYFSPEIVNAFIEVEFSESFWIALEDRHITRYTWDMGKFESKRMISISELKQLSLILAYIVDQKSSFTAQHSTKVGDLAHYLAKECKLSNEQCEKIQIAGYLHDIGKLRTPDNILEKQGPLNDAERNIMNQHSYETYEILRNIDGLEDISKWAAFHHEHINGSGYPFNPPKDKLSIEARIIAVADVFQALAQDRPYRKGMPLREILTILNQFTIEKKLDKDIVNIVKKKMNKCYEIASNDSSEQKEFESIKS